jgi:hypothetical protein
MSLVAPGHNPLPIKLLLQPDQKPIPIHSQNIDHFLAQDLEGNISFIFTKK